jgi:hypothetical protein
MKALSIHPAWAYAIMHLGKDIENRTWRTHHRGLLLIHAGGRLTAGELEGLQAEARRRRLNIPERHEILVGGIIGTVDLVDVVEHSRSSWYRGPLGWVMREPRLLPFVPLKGRLGLFDVPDRAIRRAKPASG